VNASFHNTLSTVLTYLLTLVPVQTIDYLPNTTLEGRFRSTDQPCSGTDGKVSLHVHECPQHVSRPARLIHSFPILHNDFVPNDCTNGWRTTKHRTEAIFMIRTVIFEIRSLDDLPAKSRKVLRSHDDQTPFHVSQRNERLAKCLRVQTRRPALLRQSRKYLSSIFYMGAPAFI